MTIPKLTVYAKELISLSQSQSVAKREMPNEIHISPKVRRLVGRIPVSYSDEELEQTKKIFGIQTFQQYRR